MVGHERAFNRHSTYAQRRIADIGQHRGEAGAVAHLDIAEGKSPSDITLTEPLVVIPMKIKDQVIGGIVVYSILEQKESFSPLDFELFNLLAGHAATALFASKLYSESERKLSTIQGFLDLLKQ